MFKKKKKGMERRGERGEKEGRKGNRGGSWRGRSLTQPRGVRDLQDEGFQTSGYGKVFLLLTVNILGFSIGNYCRTLRGIWFRTIMWMNCLLAIILVASAYKRQYYFFYLC